MEVGMNPVIGMRKSWHDVMQIDAPPARVFPLLCPVREYEWIESWRCQVLYSESGVAEEGCVFRTNFEDAGQMTWIVSRYEAPWRIEFSCVVPGSYTMRLKLELSAHGTGTTLVWTREFTATDPAGERWVAAYTATQHQAMMEMLARTLKHYLSTGTMLHDTHTQAQPVE
jgi:hypothetical protein